jgi:hypothetical protein
MTFIPSLELSRMLFEEHIEPIIETHFPDLSFAAATFGMCSESFGLDDEISMDHMWGPRVTILLSNQDFNLFHDKLQSALRELLPSEFNGFKTTWMPPGVDVISTKEKILYSVWTTTTSASLGFCGGLDALPLKDIEWLKVSEQHLAEFTNGVVYRDDLGEFSGARELLRYYPDDVLKFLLTSEWNTIGGDWFPIGRIGTKGDRLGLHIQTAKITQHMMRIAFMVSRKYFTYKKWFGTQFKQLPIAEALEPVLLELVNESKWQKVEEIIGQAMIILLHFQNKLGISPPIKLHAEKATDGRHYLDFDFWKTGQTLSADLTPPLRKIMNNQVFWLHDRNQILWNEEVGKWSMLLQK